MCQLFRSHFSTPRRPFTSRFLKSSHHHQTTKSSDDEDDTNNNGSFAAQGANINSNDEDSKQTKEAEKRVRYQKVGAVLNGGTVIRIRREVSTSEESDQSTENQEADAENDAEKEASPSPEPEEPPEDPLDKEERELNEQLMLSLTLTLVDEENIRQRLVEIKKSRLRNNQQTLGQNLVEKFVNDADVTLFECQLSPAKEEEEKHLLQKYAAASITFLAVN